MTVTPGHGARHLAGTALSPASVEAEIIRSVQSAGAGTGTHWGWIQLNRETIQYRAFLLPDGRTNVGTYMRVPQPLSNARVP